MSRYEDGLRMATNIFEAAAYHHTIKVECGKCRHVNYFQPHGLWWRFQRKGWDDDFRSAKDRLYCWDCWKRLKRKVRPTRIETCKNPPKLKLPLPDEREWKRALNRYRG